METEEQCVDDENLPLPVLSSDEVSFIIHRDFEDYLVDNCWEMSHLFHNKLKL